MRYRIMVDNVDIYREERDMMLYSAKLEIEIGAAGTLDITFPATHVYIDRIQLMLSTIEVLEDNEVIWVGRATSVEVDSYNQKTYKCEGALAYLNDTVARQFWSVDSPAHVLMLILQGHNEQALPRRTIRTGIISNPFASQFCEFDFSSGNCLETINTNLVGRFGGYLVMQSTHDENILHWVNKLEDLSGESSHYPLLYYGINLKDLQWSMDISDYVTQVLPYGKEVATPTKEYVKRSEWKSWQENNADKDFTYEVTEWELSDSAPKPVGYLVTYWDNNTDPRPDGFDVSGEPCTIRSINNGSDLISTPAVSVYGPITKVMTYSDVTDRHVLYARALAYLTQQQWDRFTFECTATDIEGIGGGQGSLIVGHMVHVVSRPNIIDANFPISKISYDLSTGLKEVTVGTRPHQTLTDFTSRHNTEDDYQYLQEETETKNTAKSASKTSKDNSNKLSNLSNLNTGLGGSDGWAHVLCSLSEYESSAKDSNTIYMVYSGQTATSSNGNATDSEGLIEDPSINNGQSSGSSGNNDQTTGGT